MPELTRHEARGVLRLTTAANRLARVDRKRVVAGVRHVQRVAEAADTDERNDEPVRARDDRVADLAAAPRAAQARGATGRARGVDDHAEALASDPQAIDEDTAAAAEHEPRRRRVVAAAEGAALRERRLHRREAARHQTDGRVAEPSEVRAPSALMTAGLVTTAVMSAFARVPVVTGAGAGAGTGAAA